MRTLLVMGLSFAFGSFCNYGAEPILLKFPALSQKDPANYRDKDLMNVLDSFGESSEPVKNLACTATVYTMISRGCGNPAAMIDDFYPDPRKYNNKSPGATRPAYVGEDSEINPDEIVASLKSRLPVILHGYGGPLKEHFLLAIGMRQNGNSTVFLALDPWPGNEKDLPGATIEIPANGPPFWHPTLKSVAFTKLRKLIPAKLDWTKIELADLAAWTSSSALAAPSSPPPASEGDASEEALWASSPMMPLGKVLASPDEFIGKTFRFYGSIGSVGITSENKVFEFQEMSQPKPGPPGQFQGWDQWLKDTQGGRRVTVYFDSWYNRKSQTVEGKKQIRGLANLSSGIVTGMSPSYFILGMVRQYSDTFQPYLALVSIKAPEELSLETARTSLNPDSSTKASRPLSFAERGRIAYRELDDVYKKLRARLDASGKKSLASDLLQLIHDRKQFPEYSQEWVQMTEQKLKDYKQRLEALK